MQTCRKNWVCASIGVSLRGFDSTAGVGQRIGHFHQESRAINFRRHDREELAIKFASAIKSQRGARTIGSDNTVSPTTGMITRSKQMHTERFGFLVSVGSFDERIGERDVMADELLRR